MRHRGDVITFSMDPHRRHGAGRAWLRTNLGSVATHRREVIDHVEHGSPILARDWHDVPMSPGEGQSWTVSVSLAEVGCFRAKTFFLPDAGSEPVWPEGGDVLIKVGPAWTCCANTIYTAFVRQFGPNCESRRELGGIDALAVERLDRAGYAVIPQSGTFRDVSRRLDFIIGELRFRIIQLLPVHPVPTTYARMGRFGSPFAALDFFAVDPALAEFDRRTTPLDQFGELVDAIHERGGKLFLDIPVNHTGWASELHAQHPEWFVRDRDSTFRSPEAWGVTWEDLSKLDYTHRGLWQYMADVFLYWCDKGVDGFRCDAGYMVPEPAWEYISARIREQYPDTVLLLEGLGGRWEVVETLLARSGLNWAYSELFQSYDKAQVEHCLGYSIGLSRTAGLLTHFAETHDNDRLATRSTAYARMRTACAALAADAGAFGITNGVEWFATEKIDVHGDSPLNWGQPDNQVADIARLNTLLSTHPAFAADAEVRVLSCASASSVSVWREARDTKGRGASTSLLVLANLDTERADTMTVRIPAGDWQGLSVFDVISRRETAVTWDSELLKLTLAPAAVLCLTVDAASLSRLDGALDRPADLRALAAPQNLRAKALEVCRHFGGDVDVSGLDLPDLERRLSESPRGFCRHVAAGDMAPVVSWTWPRDARRAVMAPPGTFLLVQGPHPFRTTLEAQEKTLRCESGLLLDDGTYFALFIPIAEYSGRCSLQLTVFEPDGPRHACAELLFLPAYEDVSVRTCFSAREVRERRCYAIAANTVNSFVQARGAWGELRSKYDALLAADLDPAFPVDRVTMLVRCRGWVVHRGYSQPLDSDSLHSFVQDRDGAILWRFLTPAGMGKAVPLNVTLTLAAAANAVFLTFHRPLSRDTADALDDASPVRIILRPDIDDRISHSTTTASLGPETRWPAAVTAKRSEFSFSASGKHRLVMRSSLGVFTLEPEWQYGVALPDDAERGLDAAADLFSPGYFSFQLDGGASAVVDARVVSGAADHEGRRVRAGTRVAETTDQTPGSIPLEEALLSAMRRSLVRRGESWSLIAGYPWFLDWGRDTLICSRGMIAAGWFEEARAILVQFARLEQSGTLPNMIHGTDASNRDTSDAPLWFVVACSDYLRTARDRAFLQTECDGRTIRDVLLSIGRSYTKGTPNGIRMDEGSGLIFSPAHYTWMDTDFPAGTPRQGYPIEIQALWCAGLAFLAEVAPSGDWSGLAAKVRTSVKRFFRRPGQLHLSDCLHAAPGQPAADAVADDALRPNQLFAVTLGAVKEKQIRRDILQACEELLVPGAIRSLADRPVRHPLPIRHGGRLLNDPANPYWGHYSGDEDTRRKPAYHNGTAWMWPFPSYCEAMFLTYGDDARAAALALLGSVAELMNQGCVAHLPEIADGDAPHAQRGCGAQAWSVAEAYRVLKVLT